MKELQTKFDLIRNISTLFYQNLNETNLILIIQIKSSQKSAINFESKILNKIQHYMYSVFENDNFTLEI
jgi:hypothetical protein